MRGFSVRRSVNAVHRAFRGQNPESDEPMSGPPVESGGLATQSGNDIKEAIWFAVVACIAMLVLIILYQAGPIIGLHAGTDEATTPAVFWILIVVCLSLCAFVPFLLKNSKPMDFKIIAILLTAVVPAVIIAFLLFSLWRAAGPG